MADFNRFEIWEADVPFEDIKESKRRPVLILSETEALVLSLKMTSHVPRYKTLDGEYEIMYWKEAGLLKPTVIQCSRILKLDRNRFTGRQYGRLQSADIIALRSMLHYMGIEK